MITPKVTIDMAGLEAAIRRYAEHNRKDLATALREQAKLLLRDLIKMTPPHSGKSALTEGSRVQRSYGEQAVKRDVGRVFTAVEDLPKAQTKEGKRLRRYLIQYAKQGRLGAAEKILRVLGYDNKVDVTPRPDQHKRARGRRGRVRENNPRILILNKEHLKKYTAEVIKKVGKAKSGWAKAARELGEPLWSWISRHAGKIPGVFEDKNLKHPTRPEITFGNLVPWAGDFDIKLFRDAVNLRVSKIAQRIEHQMKARAKQEGAVVRG